MVADQDRRRSAGLLDLAALDPDAPALDDLTRRRTRGEQVERAGQIVHLLRSELGARSDDHVAMVMGNRVEFVELCLGSLLAGTWMTPVNWHLTAGEAAAVIADSGASVVFADPAHEELAREAAGGTPVVTVGEELDSLLGGRPVSIDLDSPPGGNMLYTSGTTGRPRGVRRTRQRTVREALEALVRSARRLGLDGGGAHLVTGPLYHAAPLGFGLMDEHSGAELVIMPRFDPSGLLRLIAEREVRNTHLVPTMFVRLLRLEPEERARSATSSLHTVLHGAAPISESVKRRMIDWWGPVLVEYWGGSEGGVVTLVSTAEWLERPGTVGRPVPDHEVWAGDDCGGPLPAGDEGLLWCRNKASAKVFEYHSDEQGGERGSVGPGTYALGDIGRVDEDGYVFLLGRSSDMMISGGVNIFPAEVEDVLRDHPAIADVAVFGVPDAEWGESVRGAVELEAGWEWSAGLEREILSWARGRLAGFKVPRSLEHHDRLPRLETGKLLTRVLRDGPRAEPDRRRVNRGAGGPTR